MKTLFGFDKQTAARRFGILLAGGAALMLAQGAAMAGIATSKHDLSSTGAFNKFTPTTGNSEICAFCHTPHGADTAAPVPLWNRALPAPGGYTTYAALGTSTLDGGVAPVGSVSLACLSCHDGTQAMNTVINAPGSGGYNATGGTWAGTWNAAGSAAAASGTLNYASIINIGTDLRNDHPVGIQYAGGGFLSSANLAATGGAAAGTAVDADFVTPRAKGNGSTANFWVDTTGGTAGTREKTDMILYTRTEATVGGVAQPFVECASCHDPHNTTNGTFLRFSNANSGLCLACHVK